MDRVRIFVSYSHHDGRWFHSPDLIPSLARSLRKEADFWWDRAELRGGDAWRKGIREAMERAGIAILLVSKDFLASDYILDVELPFLLERARTQGLIIFPLLVGRCLWDRIPELAEIQFANGTTPLIQVADNGNLWDEAEHVILSALLARVRERAAQGEAPGSAPWVEPLTNMVFLSAPIGGFLAGASRTPGRPGFDPEAGRFEGPARDEQITSAFLLGRTPVSVGEYARFVEAHPEMPRPLSWERQRQADPLCPVVDLSWHLARGFCWWLNTCGALPRGFFADLPTELEWEWAARGPESRRYPWGSQDPDSQRAVFELQEQGPLALGERLQGAGPFGHLDLAGNVWEWCFDGWRERLEAGGDLYRLSTGTCHAGRTDSNRVYRGGSWATKRKDLRTTARDGAPPEFCCDDLGFRVVLRSKGRDHEV